MFMNQRRKNEDQGESRDILKNYLFTIDHEN